MDPALLKERALFKQRALAQPVVEKKKSKVPSGSDVHRKKNKTSSQPVASGSSGVVSVPNNFKALQSGSKYKFGILAKIVNYMRLRHQRGDLYPLTLDEILDETNQTDAGHKQKLWLLNEALPNNPKIELEDGKYVFKPPLNIRSRKELLRLLNRYDREGLGGIMMDDIIESLPNAEKAIKNLGDKVLILTRQTDKKRIVFYNDKCYQLQVESEFKELWNSTAVDSLDEGKIEEYLKKQGISSMRDFGVKKFTTTNKRKARPSNRPRKFKKHNDHMGDILKDYTVDEQKNK